MGFFKRAESAACEEEASMETELDTLRAPVKFGEPLSPSESLLVHLFQCESEKFCANFQVSDRSRR